MKPYLILATMLALSFCAQPVQRVAQQYSIEEFYKTTAIGNGSFSDDESKLLVHNDASDIFNLYEINISDGSKTQLTFSQKESFFAIDYVPGTNQILYSADKGGNEISHIYLLEDTTSTDLTPGENEKANFGGWSKDKKYMYYISNKRDPKFFDFYKMEVGSWEPQLIYQNDDGLNISDMSNDESTLALSKSITTSENKLYLVSSSGGEMTDLSEEKGNYNGMGFSDDGQYYFYVSNAGKEFAYLVQYEVASGNKEVIFETDWDVMYSYTSENEKYRVIAINEDAKNNLIVLNNVTGEKVEFPVIPDGDVMGVQFSDSEKLIRLTVGTSKAPNNLYVYNFETKALKKLTETMNPDMNPDDLVSADVVRYPSFDSLDIPAIYYKPINASADNKVPALVWVHGGPGGQSRTGYSALIQYLVNHGYAVLAVNNRGSSGYGASFYKMDDLNHGDKDLKDCIWGKKWLQNQVDIDADKIGILGGSYGGYMTMAALAFAPEEFDVGVNIFGVTNWLRTLKSIPPYWESFREALYKELGDPYSADSVRLYEISPLFHASKVTKPLMVLQGANDPRVLQIESDEIVEAVEQNGVPVEYLVFPDEGHGFAKKENRIESNAKILQFLDQYLKGIPVEKEAAGTENM